MSFAARSVAIAVATASLRGLSPVFGYATVIAVSQSGAQPSQSEYIAGSAVQVDAAYFDVDGNPLRPAQVKWCLLSMSDAVTDCCVQLTPWVSISPGLTNVIVVPGPKNTMVNLTRQFETHAVLVQIIDANGNIAYGRTLFTVARVCGAPLTLIVGGIVVGVSDQVGEVT